VDPNKGANLAGTLGGLEGAAIIDALAVHVDQVLPQWNVGRQCDRRSSCVEGRQQLAPFLPYPFTCLSSSSSLSHSFFFSNTELSPTHFAPSLDLTL
jgi:hypothetical protein